MNTTTQKYATALLSLAVVLVTAVVAMPDYTLVSILQFVVLGAGAVVTYVVPLLEGGWRGGLKTGIAVLAAVITAAIPLIGGVWNVQTIAVVVLAAVNALATQLGVNIRVDSTVPAPVTVNVANPAALPPAN